MENKLLDLAKNKLDEAMKNNSETASFYWSAYISGAMAQQVEDLQEFEKLRKEISDSYDKDF